MTITAESVALQEQLDAQLQAVTDAQVRTMVAAWALAWSEISADLQDTLEGLLTAGARITRTTLIRSLRLRRVLGAVETNLRTLAADAAITITADLTSVVDTAATAQTSIVDAMLPDAAGVAGLLSKPWTPADDHALTAIVERSTQQITSLTHPISAEAHDVVRRELIRGIAAGKNPRDTARRMVARAEGGFNGGLARAMTIARTETLDAHRAAAKHGQDRHADVLVGWTWLAHLGPRTCPACLAKHGTLHTGDEPGPEGHQNCRCSRMPATKSWADLGIDLPEPEPAVPDGRAWFDAQDAGVQRRILGPERLRLLRAGEISWEDLAQLRHTTGWRDSWHVTPLKTLRAQSSRARRAS